mmetsp:Transcript_86772/g.193180  ORF Transcript_86772/g.193180 Transcript_86772/m.193180 type:complete len:92 (-) Transcript_86772:109-384(-)
MSTHSAVLILRNLCEASVQSLVLCEFLRVLCGIALYALFPLITDFFASCQLPWLIAVTMAVNIVGKFVMRRLHELGVSKFELGMYLHMNTC